MMGILSFVCCGLLVIIYSIIVYGLGFSNGLDAMKKELLKLLDDHEKNK